MPSNLTFILLVSYFTVLLLTIFARFPTAALVILVLHNSSSSAFRHLSLPPWPLSLKRLQQLIAFEYLSLLLVGNFFFLWLFSCFVESK
ncbi:hypothetical protein QR685DRAFT_354567 [Neurospora intermedia]|uniref:Uncharacterized protein n=1 Tax=Neurospora intermedia TaxID=5142 RepID=A0ABR3D5X4_NEUIN